MCSSLALFCVQVVLVGESQGGHVAARLADLAEPELLVLLASLPDVPEVARLRASGQATAIGWKVFALASWRVLVTAARGLCMLRIPLCVSRTRTTFGMVAREQS